MNDHFFAQVYRLDLLPQQSPGSAEEQADGAIELVRWHAKAGLPVHLVERDEVQALLEWLEEHRAELIAEEKRKEDE